MMIKNIKDIECNSLDLGLERVVFCLNFYLKEFVKEAKSYWSSCYLESQANRIRGIVSVLYRLCIISFESYLKIYTFIRCLINYAGHTYESCLLDYKTKLEKSFYKEILK